MKTQAPGQKYQPKITTMQKTTIEWQYSFDLAIKKGFDFPSVQMTPTFVMTIKDLTVPHLTEKDNTNPTAKFASIVADYIITATDAYHILVRWL